MPEDGASGRLVRQGRTPERARPPMPRDGAATDTGVGTVAVWLGDPSLDLRHARDLSDPLTATVSGNRAPATVTWSSSNTYSIRSVTPVA